MAGGRDSALLAPLGERQLGAERGNDFGRQGPVVPGRLVELIVRDEGQGGTRCVEGEQAEFWGGLFVLEGLTTGAWEQWILGLELRLWLGPETPHSCHWVIKVALPWVARGSVPPAQAPRRVWDW